MKMLALTLALLALLALTGCISLTQKTGIRAPERVATYADAALLDPANTDAERGMLRAAIGELRPVVAPGE